MYKRQVGALPFLRPLHGQVDHIQLVEPAGFDPHVAVCICLLYTSLTRVNNKLSKFMNLLIVFSMGVPFRCV